MDQHQFMDQVPERDAMLEETGAYDPNYLANPPRGVQGKQIHLPRVKPNGAKMTEWEEAVALD